jgi:CRP/FNR family cyclic AMP-dependent transcriptional regulator
MDGMKQVEFDPYKYLTSPGIGRRLIRFKAKHVFFSQGSPADAVFYIHSGRAKLTVVSTKGKEATVTLLAAGDFVGEESISEPCRLHAATACAISACVVLSIDSAEMRRIMHAEHPFSDLFLKFMVARSIRVQADLVDQLFNSSERRLARILLLMAEYGQPGDPTALIAPITQETLAEMIGMTRSRVSFFMNRFRRLGYIQYKGRIRVHKSLLNAVLRDQLPEQDSSMPKFPVLQRIASNAA